MAEGSASPQQNVRFLGVGRLQDRVALGWCTLGDAREARAELFESKFRRLLASGRLAEHDRLTVADREVGAIHYEADQVCIFVAMCSAGYPQRVAFKLLAELRDQFGESFGADARYVREGELNKPAKRMLKELGYRFEQVQNVDEIESVRVQVEEVKGVMESNIQQTLRNQENLDTLIDKTDAMRNEAFNFQRTSVAVKNKFWWQNTTYLILIVVALVVLILVIVLPIALK